jgi:predicted ATPase/class 3 adenylate cyclase
MTMALPSGTVTFLFTDIESSTRLLHELGAEYAEALAEHRRVLRDAFDRHGGVEVDTQGDAFFVAFARASDALAAAREAQSALTGPVRVRVGVHTGEPLVTEEGYVGIDVHRAARIAAAGHGGQVLVSQSTRDLVGADGLRDLGDHRLKDLSAPERIYQLGDGDFPPLKSLNRTNLPVQPTPLVGRTTELVEVANLMRSSRLVTLTGAGGSGKTRLALQAAADATGEFSDGVWFVPLGAINEPDVVETTIGSLIGAEEDLGSFLTPKRLLLVLDNLEQLLPDVGLIVARLLAAPDVHVLGTSRERLGVSAEQEYVVPTLALDEAAALFTTRARQLKPSFEPDEYVDEIASRLDGLPLALELAAGRVKVLTTKQILERVGQSLDLLTAGPKDMPERQRTLRATIEWSHNLLGSREQESFCNLGVFAGSFDSAAALSVVDADLDTLASLVDKSLLRQTDEGRFFMLETIREFAREKLSSSEGYVRVRARHAELVLAHATLPTEGDPVAWLAGIEREYPEHLAALDWLRERQDYERLAALVSRLGRFWDGRARFSEGRFWLETSLQHVPPEATRERAAMLRWLGHIAGRQGDYETARSAISDAQIAALELGDDDLLAWLHSNLGAVAYMTGDNSGARSENERALRIYEQSGSHRRIMITMQDLGLIALADRDYRRARENVEESLRLCREFGFLDNEPDILALFGYIELAEGHVERAGKTLRESLGLARDRGVVDLSTANDLYALAIVLAEEGQQSNACLAVGAADAAYETSGGALEPTPAKMRQRAVNATDDQLGSERGGVIRAQGATLTLVEAIERVLAID